MGSWNYYIDLKVDKSILEDMIYKYQQNKTYQAAFYFGKKDESFSNNYNAGFMAVIDNFLPTNHLIYNFLSLYASHDLYIRTNRIERIYDFTRKSQFVKFMYDVWEKKIDFAYESLGVIVLDYKQYYKIRNRLYKKYYMRIPRVIEQTTRMRNRKDVKIPQGTALKIKRIMWNNSGDAITQGTVRNH